MSREDEDEAKVEEVTGEFEEDEYYLMNQLISDALSDETSMRAAARTAKRAAKEAKRVAAKRAAKEPETATLALAANQAISGYAFVENVREGKCD